MRLELGSFSVRDVVFSDNTYYRDGVLHVSKSELLGHLTNGSNFKEINIDIARPGEDTRIIHALDIVEPRVKASGSGVVFPGVLGHPLTVGQGRTHRLAGATVIGVAEPFAGEDYWYGREAVIDMSGPGAAYTPFSTTFNVVLTVVPKDGGGVCGEKLNYMVDAWTNEARASMNEVRVATIKAAEYLARTVRDLKPDEVKAYELTSTLRELPRVVYIHHNIGAALYGTNRYASDHAMLLHPNEAMDGALVLTTRFVQAALRDCTYFYQNNSLVEDLYARHGKEVAFAGIIFFTGFGYTMEEKELESDSVVKMARMLGAHGAIITPFRPGHSGVTFMMVCQKCEKVGIKTAIGVAQLITGREDPGLNWWVPEADAMVTPGDDMQPVELPAMSRVLGGNRLLTTGIEAAGPLKLDLRRLYGATAPMGPTRLSGRLH